MSLLNKFKGWDGELTVKLIHWVCQDNARDQPPLLAVG